LNKHWMYEKFVEILINPYLQELELNDEEPGESLRNIPLHAQKV